MNKYTSNAIIFLILLFQVISPHFTWAQNTSTCSNLQNQLPYEFAVLSSNELRSVSIQLKAKLERNQETLDDDQIGYYSRFSELYNCMVAEERWTPVAQRGRVQSALDWIPGYLEPTRMTREQLQKLPPEVIHSIWWNLANIQVSWLTVEQLNYRLSRGALAPTHKTYLTRDQVQGINQENVQNVLDRFDLYRWWRWLSDEQISWLSQEQLHTLILDLREQTIIEKPKN